MINQPFQITQIYYSEETLRKCYNHAGVTRWQNPANPAPLFETKVFLEVRPSLNALYRGVWSWKAEQKIKLAGNPNFTLEFLAHKCKEYYPEKVQLIGFHKNLTRQIVFHGDEKEEFDKHFSIILENYHLPLDYKRKIVVMNNHFLLENFEVFPHYQKFLKSYVDLIKNTPVLWEFSKKRSSYQSHSPVNYCYMPFLLEMAPSIYATVMDLNCKFY
jgi:hypothetical protein